MLSFRPCNFRQVVTSDRMILYLVCNHHHLIILLEVFYPINWQQHHYFLVEFLGSLSGSLNETIFYFIYNQAIPTCVLLSPWCFTELPLPFCQLNDTCKLLSPLRVLSIILHLTKCYRGKWQNPPGVLTWFELLRIIDSPEFIITNVQFLKALSRSKKNIVHIRNYLRLVPKTCSSWTHWINLQTVYAPFIFVG